MKCPNCKAELKQTDLVGKSTNPTAAWYQVTGTELHCPKCDSKITFSGRPQIVAGISSIIYACVLIFNLVYPAYPYKLETNLFGIFILIMGLIYWHRSKTLMLAKWSLAPMSRSRVNSY